MNSKKKTYLVGIKGVAMTSLAVFLKEKGVEVVGSDVMDKFATDKVLADYRIPILKGFNIHNISCAEVAEVIGTGAHGGMTNPEMSMAVSRGIPTYMHGEYLGKIMDEFTGISVAGCHGKTTTSSMLALLLRKSGYYPSYAIGTAEINSLGPGGHFGNGKYFIAEADEYMTCPVSCRKPRLLWQHPELIILTNIEYDHPDAYRNLEEIQDVYTQFIGTLKSKNNGLAILCRDDENTRKIIPKLDADYTTYGFSPDADYHITHVHYTAGGLIMRVRYKNIRLGEFFLRVPGKHNILNALAASIAANTYGLSWEKIPQFLKLYTGAKRRFETIFEKNKIVLIDDYAHHPSEIKATITAAKNWFPGRRMIVVFQPHTFSRTKMLFDKFSSSFSGADVVILADIYSSARENFDPTVNSRKLSAAINRFIDKTKYFPNTTKIMEFLKKNTVQNDVIITMGAGDIYKLHPDIINMIKKIT